MGSMQCSPSYPGVRGQDEILALGQTVKVRVNVMGTRLFTWLSLELHGDGNTSSISIWRMSPNDKTIRWAAYWNGNTPPYDPTSSLQSDDGDGAYPEQEFPGGQHTFLVSRRPAVPGTPEHMAVWLEQRPERVARVAVQPGTERLKVTTFIGSISPKFYTEPRAMDCSRQGMGLDVGEKVRVGVTIYSTDLGPVFVVRRPGDSPSDGSRVTVTGIAKDRRMWTYEASGPDGKVVGRFTDMPGYRPKDSLNMPRLRPQLPEGESLFVLERKASTEVVVWLEENPDFVAKMPVPRGPIYLSVEADLNLVLYEKA